MPSRYPPPRTVCTTVGLPGSSSILRRRFFTCESTVRDQVVVLTPTEWGILVALATVPGRVYSRFELINRVRGYEFDGYERTVDSHVKNLRRKIEDDPASPEIIQTVLGGGYRLGLAADG